MKYFIEINFCPGCLYAPFYPGLMLCDFPPKRRTVVDPGGFFIPDSHVRGKVL
jgi:hypothetical protein